MNLFFHGYVFFTEFCCSYSRVSAVGGEGGKVEVFHVTLDPVPRVTSSQSVSWDYPVASVNTFHLNNTLAVPKFLKGNVYFVWKIGVTCFHDYSIPWHWSTYWSIYQAG